MTKASAETSTPIVERMAHAIRFLAIDAVENAKSGHPGAPMGMAEIAEVLWIKLYKTVDNYAVFCG